MQTHNIKPMCWSPLGNVFKKKDEQTERIKTTASKLSSKYSVPLDVILLAWILKHPAGIIPVFGTADPGRISNLMKSTAVDLELQDWFKLWSESAGVPIP